MASNLSKQQILDFNPDSPAAHPNPQLGYPGHHQGTTGQTKKSADRRWPEPSVYPGWDRSSPETCPISEEGPDSMSPCSEPSCMQGLSRGGGKERGRDHSLSEGEPSSGLGRGPGGRTRLRPQGCKGQWAVPYNFGAHFGHRV